MQKSKIRENEVEYQEERGEDLRLVRTKCRCVNRCTVRTNDFWNAKPRVCAGVAAANAAPDDGRMRRRLSRCLRTIEEDRDVIMVLAFLSISINKPEPRGKNPERHFHGLSWGCDLARWRHDRPERHRMAHQ
jgi:hypothetical protein